jgi:hypothetical protein
VTNLVNEELARSGRRTALSNFRALCRISRRLYGFYGFHGFYVTRTSSLPYGSTAVSFLPLLIAVSVLCCFLPRVSRDRKSRLVQPLSLARSASIVGLATDNSTVYLLEILEIPNFSLYGACRVHLCRMGHPCCPLHTLERLWGRLAVMGVQMDQEKQPLNGQPRGITAHPAYIYLILTYYLIIKHAAQSPIAARQHGKRRLQSCWLEACLV